jgi:hypothetical protein
VKDDQSPKRIDCYLVEVDFDLVQQLDENEWSWGNAGLTN